MKEIIPVLHIKDEKQAVKNLELLKELELKKVFVIGHGGPYSVDTNLLHISWMACKMGFWCGVNFLGYNPIEMIKKYGEHSFVSLWYDNSYAGIDNDATRAIFDERVGYSKRIELWGGVAFKYCPQPDSLEEACEVASKYVDVIVTSGVGTGHAADTNKIKLMRSYLGDKARLAIASGITPENVMNYSDADIFMVSTGVSKDFYNFDADKLKMLIESVG